EGQDVRTDDLASGDSGSLSVGDLPEGEYTGLCEIAGHPDAGMTGTLTVSGGAGGGEGEVAAGGGSHGGGHDDMDYAQMTQDMLDSVLAFPAETEGRGNQLLEPTEVLADGTKVYDMTMELAEWEVSPGETVEA